MSWVLGDILPGYFMGTIVRLCNFPCEMSRFLVSVVFHVLVTFPD